MNKRDPKLTVLLFNECINNQNISDLSRLMDDDYTFIDSENSVHSGRNLMVKGWKEFFSLYPDYRNHFTNLVTRDDMVIIQGYSTCSYEPLDGPAIWTAVIKNDFVLEWRVYLDTVENRKKLELK